MPSDGNSRRPGSTRREDSFLARWSRRKHQAEHGVPVEENDPAETPVDTDAQPTDGDTDLPEGEAAIAVPDTGPADADLPHPDTLDRDSDFSVYLTRRVSSTFRRAAMRRLFSSPAFNVRDGLDDYDDDYTQFQSLGNTVTAHMRHHAERLRQREQDKIEQAEQGEPEQATEQDAQATPAPDGQQAGTTDDPTSTDDAPDPTNTARTVTNRDTDDTT